MQSIPIDHAAKARHLWAAMPHLPGFVTYLYDADAPAPNENARRDQEDMRQGDEVPPYVLGEDT